MSHIRRVKEGQTNLVMPDLLHTGGLWSTSQDLYKAELERAQTAASYRLQGHQGASRQSIPTTRRAGPYVVPGGHSYLSVTWQTVRATAGPHRNLFGGQTQGLGHVRPTSGRAGTRQPLQSLCAESLLQTQSLANVSQMYENSSNVGKSVGPSARYELPRKLKTASSCLAATEGQAQKEVIYVPDDEFDEIPFDPIPSDFHCSTPLSSPTAIDCKWETTSEEGSSPTAIDCKWETSEEGSSPTAIDCKWETTSEEGSSPTAIDCKWETTSEEGGESSPDISAVEPAPLSASTAQKTPGTIVWKDHGNPSSRAVAVPSSTAVVNQGTSASQIGQTSAGMAGPAWSSGPTSQAPVYGCAREGLAQDNTDDNVPWLGSLWNTAPYRIAPVAARMGRFESDDQPSFEEIKEITDLENDADKPKGDDGAGFFADFTRRNRNRRLRMRLTVIMDRLARENRPVFVLEDKLKPLKPYVISGWISDDYLLALLQKPNLINQMFGDAMDSLDEIRKDVVEKCSKRNPVVFTRELVYRVFTLGELENTGMKFTRLSHRKMGAVRRCVKTHFPEMTQNVWRNSCLWKLRCHMTFVLSKRVRRVQAFWLKETVKSPMAI